MSRKRRMFDISMPDDLPDDLPDPSAEPATETFPAGKEDRPARRGPMATAISETAGAARERQQVEAQIRAENDALAHEHVRLKKLGLVLEVLPLDAVETYKLTRDRAPGPDPELDELKQSIQDIGLSNPIRVEPREDGKFELIQGFRRLSAYRALYEETDDDLWARIPAAITPRGDSLESLYRRMVDENMVRKDISFAEMAKLAVDYAAEPGTQETDPDKAVAVLFKSAGYQKRSYIRTFIKVIGRIGGALIYPHEIPRALGLALAQQLDQDPALAGHIRSDLEGWENRSVMDELGVLRRAAGLGAVQDGQGVQTAAPKPKAPAAGKAKTSFQLERREGRAKCTAASGRLEIRLNRDFTTIDRRKLEQAVQQMLDNLD
ncbi:MULTISPECIES: ParB/RepB/Spo0J family partition protein [Shimia]|uniref:ParB/RepB/Spo0J family partition protein n=1 Tax=Shimia TaxID=573139 RepID=UPI001FB2CCF9|nr:MULTISPECIES: ParB N-terminal domain-containing protein [Shimia]MDV4146486.1 ParB N-terminal domain-containing protein [Shimia sp. FJ5]